MPTLKEAGRGGRRRRIHSAEFKAQVVAACSVPGVSKAAVSIVAGGLPAARDSIGRR